MSTPRLSPPTQFIPQPEPKSTETPPSNPPPPNGENHYTCTCGRPDSSENWICCDNSNCPIKWYHWECARVTAASLPGEWFCPTCRPSTPPRTKAAAKKDPRTTRSARKKGIAIKKATPKKKGRSKWVGWVEVASEDEDADADAAAVRAKTKETMIHATKSGGRVRKSRTPLGRKSKSIKAREHDESDEKWQIKSDGGLFEEEEHGTELVARKRSTKRQA